MADAYRDAGVDIDAGEALVRRIAPLAKSTHRSEVLGGLGGFGGLFALGQSYDDPVLVSGTDGVGTKLLLAERLGRFDTVGIDLVAMCVNDVLCSGAEPLFFLDYLATGKLDVEQAASVVSGIAEGCRQAGCALIGGETAEMPGMYAPGRVDVAGFVVGCVERSKILSPEQVQAGDVLLGIPSTGLHSNGYSLARKLLVDVEAPDPKVLDALMTPTAIYVDRVLPHMRSGDVHGAAHITGGGLTDNIPRMLPPGLGAVIDRATWERPALFDQLQQTGALSDAEMYRTFNMGIGMVLCVRPEAAERVAQVIGGHIIGHIIDGQAVTYA
ncbi:MAG: phosphoribosylformylglycinamidine cyclo-ligase [Myxococcota bacterium]|jgi:phosphoribosylformylglycinamidine cyclo-ligase